jgi:transcription elongation GreA/GreB family factor
MPHTNPPETAPAITKKELYALCENVVRQRIETARQAMTAAQESANEEGKSSAGDKYETGRAMAQIERDRHAHLLADALAMAQDLARINADKTYTTAQPGSLVTTNRGVFFISVGAGKLPTNPAVFAVSSASPIAVALATKTMNEQVVLNKISYTILSIR